MAALRDIVNDGAVGYLYRVAGSASRRHRRWMRRVLLPAEVRQPAEPTDDGLQIALARLSEPQRVCIVMVHVYDWSYQQTAAATGLSLAAVTNHVHRGLRRLCTELGASYE